LADNNSSLQKYLSLSLLKTLPSPPKNDDPIVLNELQFIIDSMRDATDEQVKFAKNVHALDNFYKLWSIFASNLTQKRYDSEFFEQISQQTDGLINYIKLHFLRPRPYVLAKFLHMPYKMHADKRFTTGSYPSGHSCEAYLFADIVGMNHPEQAPILQKFADKMANSRIIAGVHFPTDILGGKKLAKQIILHNLCKYNF
jgi:acid phosphatase (class A)